MIEAELGKYPDYPKDRIRVVHASQVIETAEPPVMAIQKKKDSSIVVGLNLVKKQEADAFVSSGSTGAVLVGGQVIVGRIQGIRRPPLAPLIPTAKGVSLLIDCGANVDARQIIWYSLRRWFHLYGRRGWNQEPSCSHCKHWCRGGEGKCPCERDVPSFEGMPGDQFYWKY